MNGYGNQIANRKREEWKIWKWTKWRAELYNFPYYKEIRLLAVAVAETVETVVFLKQSVVGRGVRIIERREISCENKINKTKWSKNCEGKENKNM